MAKIIRTKDVRSLLDGTSLTFLPESGETYCPTYEQITGSSAYYSSGTVTTGLNIKSYTIGDEKSSYDHNQLVGVEDVELKADGLVSYTIYDTGSTAAQSVTLKDGTGDTATTIATVTFNNKVATYSVAETSAKTTLYATFNGTPLPPLTEYNISMSPSTITVDSPLSGSTSLVVNAEETTITYAWPSNLSVRKNGSVSSGIISTKTSSSLPFGPMGYSVTCGADWVVMNRMQNGIIGWEQNDGETRSAVITATIVSDTSKSVTTTVSQVAAIMNEYKVYYFDYEGTNTTDYTKDAESTIYGISGSFDKTDEDGILYSSVSIANGPATVTAFVEDAEFWTAYDAMTLSTPDTVANTGGTGTVTVTCPVRVYKDPVNEKTVSANGSVTFYMQPTDDTTGWTAVSNDDWLTISNSGTSFTAAENTNSSKRTGSITYTQEGSGNKFTTYVNQNAANIWNLYLTYVDEDNMNGKYTSGATIECVSTSDSSRKFSAVCDMNGGASIDFINLRTNENFTATVKRSSIIADYTFEVSNASTVANTGGTGSMTIKSTVTNYSDIDPFTLTYDDILNANYETHMNKSTAETDYTISVISGASWLSVNADGTTYTCKSNGGAERTGVIRYTQLTSGKVEDRVVTQSAGSVTTYTLYYYDKSGTTTANHTSGTTLTATVNGETLTATINESGIATFTTNNGPATISATYTSTPSAWNDNYQISLSQQTYTYEYNPSDLAEIEVTSTSDLHQHTSVSSVEISSSTATTVYMSTSTVDSIPSAKVTILDGPDNWLEEDSMTTTATSHVYTWYAIFNNVNTSDNAYHASILFTNNTANITAYATQNTNAKETFTLYTNAEDGTQVGWYDDYGGLIDSGIELKTVQDGKSYMSYPIGTIENADKCNLYALFSNLPSPTTGSSLSVDFNTWELSNGDGYSRIVGLSCSDIKTSYISIDPATGIQSAQIMFVEEGGNILKYDGYLDIKEETKETEITPTSSNVTISQTSSWVSYDFATDSLIVEPNNLPSVRTATITFEYNGSEETISITQPAAKGLYYSVHTNVPIDDSYAAEAYCNFYDASGNPIDQVLFDQETQIASHTTFISEGVLSATTEMDSGDDWVVDYALDYTPSYVFTANEVESATDVTYDSNSGTYNIFVTSYSDNPTKTGTVTVSPIYSSTGYSAEILSSTTTNFENYTISNSNDWFTVTKSESACTITLTENKSESARDGSFTITQDNSSKSITITVFQLGMDAVTYTVYSNQANSPFAILDSDGTVYATGVTSSVANSNNSYQTFGASAEEEDAPNLSTVFQPEYLKYGGTVTMKKSLAPSICYVKMTNTFTDSTSYQMKIKKGSTGTDSSSMLLTVKGNEVSQNIGVKSTKTVTHKEWGNNNNSICASNGSITINYDESKIVTDAPYTISRSGTTESPLVYSIENEQNVVVTVPANKTSSARTYASGTGCLVFSIDESPTTTALLQVKQSGGTSYSYTVEYFDNESNEYAHTTNASITLDGDDYDTTNGSAVVTKINGNQSYAFTHNGPTTWYEQDGFTFKFTDDSYEEEGINAIPYDGGDIYYTIDCPYYSFTQGTGGTVYKSSTAVTYVEKTKVVPEVDELYLIDSNGKYINDPATELVNENGDAILDTYEASYDSTNERWNVHIHFIGDDVEDGEEHVIRYQHQHTEFETSVTIYRKANSQHFVELYYYDEEGTTSSKFTSGTTISVYSDDEASELLATGTVNQFGYCQIPVDVDGDVYILDNFSTRGEYEFDVLYDDTNKESVNGMTYHVATNGTQIPVIVSSTENRITSATEFDNPYTITVDTRADANVFYAIKSKSTVQASLSASSETGLSTSDTKDASGNLTKQTIIFSNNTGVSGRKYEIVYTQTGTGKTVRFNVYQNATVTYTLYSNISAATCTMSVDGTDKLSEQVGSDGVSVYSDESFSLPEELTATLTNHGLPTTQYGSWSCPTTYIVPVSGGTFACTATISKIYNYISGLINYASITKNGSATINSASTTSNAEYKVNSDSDWLKVVSGTNTSGFSFTCGANTTNSSKTAILTLSPVTTGAFDTKTISISQAAATFETQYKYEIRVVSGGSVITSATVGALETSLNVSVQVKTYSRQHSLYSESEWTTDGTWVTTTLFSATNSTFSQNLTTTDKSWTAIYTYDIENYDGSQAQTLLNVTQKNGGSSSTYFISTVKINEENNTKTQVFSGEHIYYVQLLWKQNQSDSSYNTETYSSAISNGSFELSPNQAATYTGIDSFAIESKSSAVLYGMKITEQGMKTKQTSSSFVTVPDNLTVNASIDFAGTSIILSTIEEELDLHDLENGIILTTSGTVLMSEIDGKACTIQVNYSDYIEE